MKPLASTVLDFTANSRFVKDSAQVKTSQPTPTAQIIPRAPDQTFRTRDRNVATLLVVAKHSLAFCGCDRDGQGGVWFTFEDLRGEGQRLAERWRDARQRLKRAARAARQGERKS